MSVRQYIYLCICYRIRITVSEWFILNNTHFLAEGYYIHRGAPSIKCLRSLNHFLVFGMDAKTSLGHWQAITDISTNYYKWGGATME